MNDEERILQSVQTIVNMLQSQIEELKLKMGALKMRQHDLEVMLSQHITKAK